jgi:DNA-binding NtrC family response regulator
MLDDEPYITLIFRKALNLLGYTVNAYNDPSVALGNFKPDYHDLVILDYRMRGINEVELAQAISKIQPETKICFMSAFEILTDERLRLTRELCTFVRNPIMPKALAVQIEKRLLKA